MSNPAKLNEISSLTEADKAVYEDDYFTLENFEQHLQRIGCFGLVARIDDVWVGHVLARSGGDEGEVLTFFVKEDLRGQGIGRALLEAAIGRFKIAGVKKILLEVRVSNLHARKLYEKIGAALVSHRANYYPPTETNPREDAAVYSLLLE